MERPLQQRHCRSQRVPQQVDLAELRAAPQRLQRAVEAAQLVAEEARGPEQGQPAEALGLGELCPEVGALSLGVGLCCLKSLFCELTRLA